MAASRSPQLRLLHIRDEIDGLSAALAGVTFDAYQGSYTFRRVTERALQIISEAARALPVDLTARHPGAPWNARTQVRHLPLILFRGSWLTEPALGPRRANVHSH
jgi:uncharacterized protein with HEPN domain